MGSKSERVGAKKKNNKLAKQIFDEENRKYFEDINSKPKLSIDVKNISLDKGSFLVSPENAVVLWIFETYKLDEWIELILVVSVDNLKNNAANFIQSDEVQDQLCSKLDKLLSEGKPKSTACIKYNSELLFTRARSVLSQRDAFVNREDGTRQKLDEPDVESCKRPSVYISEKGLVICGLSSVLRFLLKFTVMKIEIQLRKDGEIENKDCKIKSKSLQQLLGFRGGCLQACAEVSIWTKFCEVDMMKTINEAMDKLAKPIQHENNSDIIEEVIPEDLVRFEHHLKTPVRVHNIRKETQSKLEKIKSKQKLPEGNTKSKEICAELLEHEYAEGPHMLLSDLILFPCVYILLYTYGEAVFEQNLPQTLVWCRKLDKLFKLSESSKILVESGTLGHLEKPCDTFSNRSGIGSKTVVWKIPVLPEKSLYKSDPARYNPTLRLFTKQNDVEDALSFCSSSSSGILVLKVGEVTSDLNWDEIPVLAHPEGGRLPEERRERKCQQLSSMAIEVMKVVEEKVKHSNTDLDDRSSVPLRIVDFCSGGGHVGILLAWLLPECQIILVENKEESLRRGRERAEQLGLTNVTMYQCNLDYFDGHFSIGVALHACGTATDLVLSKCIAANASFVCCPCCYGAIQPNHMLHYPASLVFKDSNISLRHYFILAHASDQTHDEKNEKTQQGKLCMQLIDTDRCLNAQENGYKVYLAKMPETSSPKNHILVGISHS